MADDLLESARLDALYQLNLLDTAPSESFDRITRTASQLFGLPISAVSLTDRDRQWFKSRVGVAHSAIPRFGAPCGQVAETTEFLVIPDLLADESYSQCLLAEQGVRFYAGAPLVTREGYGLGALCVLGNEPREVTEAEATALRDLAAMVMAQIELQHAYGRIEPVSGLPNRVQFLEDLEDLARDHPGQRRVAVLVDLARTEQLNSSLGVMGPGFIDEMVQDAARTMRAVLGPDCFAYHVSATRFAYLTGPEAALESHLPHLLSLLRQVGHGLSGRFMTTAAIGVAPFVTGEMSPRDVLRTAHSAAQDARETENRIGIYSATSDAIHKRRFRLLNDFAAALDADDQLSMVYQPRIDAASSVCVGAEALLRWHHPELGNISPAEFIPVVEQTTLARRTTAWVLDYALSQMGEWHRQGLGLNVSVNISAANLGEPDFAEMVQLRLLKHRLPAEVLELEVTESAMMADPAAALDQLKALDAAGIRLAIDDFGTGYSSLAYLERLPVQVVKIDQSFIRNVTLGEREHNLVRAMVELTHGLGYKVVAEGVETEAIADAIAAMGCDEAQGYFYARPMTAAAFEAWLAEAGTAPQQAAA